MTAEADTGDSVCPDQLCLPGESRCYCGQNLFPDTSSSIVLFPLSFQSPGRIDLGLYEPMGGPASGSLRLLANDGSAVFYVGPPNSLSSPRGFAAGDFDGDGIDEVVIGRGDSPSVRLYTSGPEGDLQLLVEQGVNVSFEVLDVAVLDLNGDDLLDVAAFVQEGVDSTSLHAFMGDGLGGLTIGAVTSYGDLFTNIDPSLRAGDVNGDTFEDVVVGGFMTALSQGTADGTFAADLISTGQNGGVAMLGDLDRDGNLDLLVRETCDCQLTPLPLHIAMGQGDGSFATAQTVEVGSDEFGGWTLDDIDDDQLLDVVLLVGPRNDRSLAVVPQTSAGQFGPLELGTSSIRDGAELRIVGDLDEDGTLDFIVGAGENGIGAYRFDRYLAE